AVLVFGLPPFQSARRYRRCGDAGGTSPLRHASLWGDAERGGTGDARTSTPRRRQLAPARHVTRSQPALVVAAHPRRATTQRLHSGPRLWLGTFHRPLRSGRLPT